MFDTVRMRVSNINISSDKLIKPNIKSKPSINEDTGEIGTEYKIKDKVIPYIVYYESTKTLLIQVSIPKLLYGENITLINENDIEQFFIVLNDRFKQLLCIDIHKDDWHITTQIDVCWNFNVGEKVSEYITQIAKLKLPYKDAILHNQCETINFKNKSSQIKLYDKRIECIDHKCSKEVIAAAKGIIRLEISPSVHDIKSHSKTKQATQLLTKDFFKKIVEPVLPQLEVPEQVSELDYDWMLKQKIQNIEMCFAFLNFMEFFNESMLKDLYGNQTFGNRKKLVQQIQFPKAKKLPNLRIDIDELG